MARSEAVYPVIERAARVKVAREQRGRGAVVDLEEDGGAGGEGARGAGDERPRGRRHEEQRANAESVGVDLGAATIAGVRYELHDGRILTWALEAHVVDHCNLRCANCCTLSPHLPARFVGVAELGADLERVGAAVRPQVFKLTGGEPLLHPDIVELARTARDAGIAPAISLTTNGWLFPEEPGKLLEALDRLTVSWYPSAPLPPPRLASIRAACETYGVLLTVKECSAFQEMGAARPHGGARAGVVYDGCWLRNRCHMVHGGRFYTCTRPPHLAVVSAASEESDGVALDVPELARAILAYLERPEPLAACRSCLGASGARVAHEQLSRTEGPGSNIEGSEACFSR